MLLITWKGDANEAARLLASGPTASRSEPRTIWVTAIVQLCQREPAAVLKTLNLSSDDYIQDNGFAGPKTYFTGRAHAMAGRQEAARLAWEAGLAVVNARLKTSPESLMMHLRRGELLAWLGQADEALQEARTVAGLMRSDRSAWFVSEALIYAAPGRADEAVPLLENICAPSAGKTSAGR
ncbi:MAG: hypothetical protein EXS38_10370 [Opitutus sp.]|nr:hypothetical protein [Opitutus sp.]